MRDYANIVSTQSIVHFCPFARVVFWLCSALMCLAQGCSDKGTPAEPVSSTVVEQWTDVAREKGLPETIIQDVNAIVKHTLSTHGLMDAATTHPDLRDSLHRFIAEFHDRFNAGGDEPGFFYYFTWLVAEAVRRGPSGKVALEAAREDFRRSKEMLATRLRNDFREQVGADFAVKYDKQIEAGIRWTQDVLMHRFEVLQADPLFPLFKGPIDPNTIKAAISSTCMPEEYNRAFNRPMQMMVREGVIQVKRLEGFFESRPELFISGLAIADLCERLPHNPYWGPADYSIRSTGRDHVWPVWAMLHVGGRRGASKVSTPIPSGSDK